MDEFKSLDDNVLQEILLRLPAKVLGRFKSVSRRWHRLISDPYFVAAHARRSQQTVPGILTVTVHPMGGRFTYFPLEGDRSEAPDVRLGFHHRVSVKAFCNGLIFFELCYSEERIMLVGNPTTKTFKQIPKIPLPTQDTRYGLAFDPAVSTTSYKIVACMRFFHVDMSSLYKFAIYSPATSWRSSEPALPSCSSLPLFDTANSVFYNGAVHWLGEEGNIIAFDVNRTMAYEKFVPREVSVNSVGGYQSVWLGVVLGSMALVKFVNGEIHVWTMADYEHNLWELKMKIRADRSKGHYRKLVPIFCNGELFTFFTWGHKKFGISVFRARTGKWDKIRRIHGNLDCCRHFFPYFSQLLGW